MKANKTLIGLTGNIATGKSTVARMLGELGALTIDADKLVHELLDEDPAVQRQVVNRFGPQFQRPDGSIDRARLGERVFPNPDSLHDLEGILHPRVGERLAEIIARAEAQVVVIEAIKLLEAGLGERCDSIWVTTCREDQQIERLMETRGMSRHEALVRVLNQPPQQEKLARADVVIDTSGSMELTAEQVRKAWQGGRQPAGRSSSHPAVEIRRANPRDVSALVSLINRTKGHGSSVDRAQILESFGEQGYMVAEVEGELRAAIGWSTEDFIARIRQIFILRTGEWETVLRMLVEAVCQAAAELMCEVALLFYPSGTPADIERLYRASQFEPAALETLIPAWRRAAEQSMPAPGGQIMVRKLREKRVMRPI
jgi:dephospho-CoA kinase